MNNISDFDKFANRIGFYFNEKERIGTFFGFILTILYISFSLILFLLFINTTINHKNIIVYHSTLFSNDIPSIDINTNLINFAFGLENPNTNTRFIDETIYSPKIFFMKSSKINGEFQIEKIELEYENCKIEYFGDNYKTFFIDNELNNSYCLKNYNVSLLGGINYNKMNYLTIKLYPCINNTQNNYHCKPQEIIDSYLNDGDLSIIIKDIGLDPSDYESPVKPSIQTLNYYIDKSIYKKYIIYYGIAQIKTDIGFIIEKIKTEKYLQFIKDVQLYNSEYYENKEIISIELRLDDKIYTLSRTYTKIYDVISLIGGYMKILNTILILISLLSHSLIPELKILNGIFNFNLKEKKMTIKIRSIKDFNSIVYKKTLYFPSDKQLTNLNTKIPNNNNNIIKNSLIANDYYENKNNNNNMNNLSKNCLIGIDNNDNNSSSININIFNKRKHNSLVIIKEKENEKSNNSNNNNSEKKISIFSGQKNNQYSFKNVYNNGNNNNVNNNNNNNCNDNKKKNNNYIYRVGSFYPKFHSAQKIHNNDNNSNNNNNNNLKNYSDQLYFNIFHYYCCGNCFRKKKEIELYKLGLSVYKKRMDIINVFTLLLFTEKNCLQAEDNYN